MEGVQKALMVESRAVASMLIVQMIATGLQLLSRVILTEGAFVFAFITYRHVVGAVCIAPFAFIWERGKEKELRWKVWFWLFMNASAGITMAMGFFYYGLRDTTATYAVNFLNLIPVTTFVFSAILRLEKIGLHCKSGNAKVLGALLCLGGALTIGLYKGKAFYIGHHNAVHSHANTHTTKPNWPRGTVFLVSSILSYAAWFIVQAKLFKSYPHKYWATLLTCIIASFEASLIGVCLDRKKASWTLGWNLQLITIMYSGALASAATFCLISWVIASKGPTYPSMFNPLSLIFVAITEALFLGEAIRVGSILGMLLIIAGLYLFLWGKGKELPPKGAPGGATATESESADMTTTITIMPTASASNDNTNVGR